MAECTLRDNPILASNRDERGRAEDACAIRLLGKSPWAACKAIEANYCGGVLSQDMAIALLWAHTERLAREIAMIAARIESCR